jgi:nitrogen fixation NifU-like protein
LSYYQDIILRHARHPCGLGALPEATHRASGTNPLCGDVVEIFAKLNDAGVVALGFESQGCALCRASASILTGEVNGKTVPDIAKTLSQLMPLFKKLVALESPPWSEDIAALSDMRRYPSRLSCVLLPWETLQKVLTSGVD